MCGQWVIKDQLRPGYVFAEIFFTYEKGGSLPSLKLTYSLKMVVSNRNLLFQRSIFRCELLVSGRVIPPNVWNLVSLSFM